MGEQEWLALREQAHTGSFEALRSERVTKGGQVMTVSLIVSALVNDARDIYALATTERPAAPAK